MKKFTLLLSLMGLFIFVQQTKAGDYGFWANTRSDITIDSKLYKLTDGTDLNGTDYVGNYDEANLGSYAIGSSLEVTNITTNTWGSVTGVKYFYIIYKKGERPASPTFTELNLTQISGGNGAENKTWQYTAPAINLTDGITEEGTYAFELYGLAEGTGNADKFEKHDTFGEAYKNYYAEFILSKPSGIDDKREESINVTSWNGSLSISGVGGQAVQVYSLTGRLVYQATASTSTVKVNNLQTGIYIVKSNDFIQKVVVR